MFVHLFGFVLLSLSFSLLRLNRHSIKIHRQTGCGVGEGERERESETRTSHHDRFNTLQDNNNNNNNIVCVFYFVVFRMLCVLFRVLILEFHTLTRPNFSTTTIENYRDRNTQRLCDQSQTHSTNSQNRDLWKQKKNKKIYT